MILEIYPTRVRAAGGRVIAVLHTRVVRWVACRSRPQSQSQQHMNVADAQKPTDVGEERETRKVGHRFRVPPSARHAKGRPTMTLVVELGWLVVFGQALYVHEHQALCMLGTRAGVQQAFIEAHPNAPNFIAIDHWARISAMPSAVRRDRASLS